jgi:hypothetical protein
VGGRAPRTPTRRLLPFADDTFDSVATSPVYPTGMTDAFTARDRPTSSRTCTATARSLGERNPPNHSNDLGASNARRDDGPYWTLSERACERACVKVTRVLRPGGVFVLNVKDHIAGGEVSARGQVSPRVPRRARLRARGCHLRPDVRTRRSRQRPLCTYLGRVGIQAACAGGGLRVRFRLLSSRIASNEAARNAAFPSALPSLKTVASVSLLSQNSSGCGIFPPPRLSVGLQRGLSLATSDNPVPTTGCEVELPSSAPSALT